MVGSALILLTHTFPTFSYILPVVLIFCREIGISALREWMAGKNLREVVKVGQTGKYKTALQMISTTLLLVACTERDNSDCNLCVFFGVSPQSVYAIGLVALYISAVLAVISGAEYFSSAWETLKKGMAIKSE
jgi:CDP-diacylglycerol--glycerol-3-phosphate 3-phosphatidyltransferase